MRPVEFAPFSDKDFDAYLPNKWESNLFNLDRFQVKQKLLALGQLLSPSMRSQDGSPLECEVSVEHPALWNQRRVTNQRLFFSRNKDARRELEGFISSKRTMAALIQDPSPLRNHIFLSVKIDHQQLEIGLKLHSEAAVDRENLQQTCQEFFAREKLLTLISTLPEGFLLTLGDEEGIPTGEVSDEDLSERIQHLSTAGTWLSVSYSIPRDDERVRDDAVADLCKERLKELLPLMHFAAWSRANDTVSMKETLKEKEVQRKSKGLNQKDRIRVANGMFSGKLGVVEEVDDKGTLKVRLGNMLVQLESDDVTKIK